MAFAGMHPFSIHFPPKAPFPKSSTFFPISAAIFAEGYPDVPAPIIIKSKSVITIPL